MTNIALEEFETRELTVEEMDAAAGGWVPIAIGVAGLVLGAAYFTYNEGRASGTARARRDNRAQARMCAAD